MFKRAFFTAVGLGAGVALGVYVVRKVEATRRRMSPDALAASAGARVDSVGARLRHALDEGRRAAAAREAELRVAYRVGQPRAGGGGSGGAAGGGSGGAAGGGSGVAEWSSPPPGVE